MEKIVIVGANHAGTAAINTILDTYQDKEVVVFDSNDNISFLGCGMALWIGQQIDGPDGLFYSNEKILSDKGAKICMNATVEKVDYQNKVVYVKDKEGKQIEENYDKLILATGSKPIIPAIKGTDLQNVQRVKLYQNAKEVIEKLAHQEMKKIAVIGAGYIGVELAEAFKRLDKEVLLMDVASTCLSGYYDQEFSDRMCKTLQEHGIQTIFEERVQELQGTDKVEKVITDKGAYDVDMVILAVGFVPNNDLGKEVLKTFKNGAYQVDLHQQTSIPDVYAIGDCATVFDNSLHDTNYIALATNAVRSGIVAAHNACGTPLESIGVQGSNGISIFGLNMVSTGLSLTKAKAHGYPATSVDYEDLQKPGFMKNNNEKVKIRIVYDEKSRVILGAQMASKYDISMGIHMFSLAIQEQVTIDRLKLLDIMFLPHFNQPYNYITMAALQAK